MGGDHKRFFRRKRDRDASLNSYGERLGIQRLREAIRECREELDEPKDFDSAVVAVHDELLFNLANARFAERSAILGASALEVQQWLLLMLKRNLTEEYQYLKMRVKAKKEKPPDLDDFDF
jgi:hypothetical protein